MIRNEYAKGLFILGILLNYFVSAFTHCLPLISFSFDHDYVLLHGALPGSYDSALLSKDEVLDVAELFFVSKIKEKEANRITPKGYFLRLFGGDPKSDFFDRFTKYTIPKVKRGAPLKAVLRKEIAIGFICRISLECMDIL
ncbi:hypothetical protein [Psychromonas ossibalaenae]|uniref:hypothetical protein n=1 Tax=Psychromonas ossibalaenae TaxID=444922 RepID=UPI000372F722|nr:hypothetical protein [Psychromonas ossibalaenae]